MLSWIGGTKWESLRDVVAIQSSTTPQAEVQPVAQSPSVSNPPNDDIEVFELRPAPTTEPVSSSPLTENRALSPERLGDPLTQENWMSLEDITDDIQQFERDLRSTEQFLEHLNWNPERVAPPDIAPPLRGTLPSFEK